MLGVFLLPTFFTRLEHECQDRLSPVRRLDIGLYFHPKEFLGNGVRTHVESKGYIPSTGGSEEGRTRDSASRWTASLTHYRLSYPGLLSETIYEIPGGEVGIDRLHPKTWHTSAVTTQYELCTRRLNTAHGWLSTCFTSRLMLLVVQGADILVTQSVDILHSFCRRREARG